MARLNLAYAKDYREPVNVLKVEKKPRGEYAGTYTVQRRNGDITRNYPGYLLEFPEKRAVRRIHG